MKHSIPLDIDESKANRAHDTIESRAGYTPHDRKVKLRLSAAWETQKMRYRTNIKDFMELRTELRTDLRTDLKTDLGADLRADLVEYKSKTL
jgi:hypothetical protein